MIIPVILAGGSGTRLWPLSRKLYPKQFMPLMEENTLFQNTILRLTSMADTHPPVILCNDTHRFLVAEQLREINVVPEAIVLEPVGRNTAPAMAVAALIAKSIDKNAILLALPADHHIQDQEKFLDTLAQGIHFAREDRLVTFGIIPDVPETGYGYIRKGSALASDHVEDAPPAWEIDKFVEKPDLAKAKAYVDSGDFFWNSGMFVFKAAQLLDELTRHAPGIVKACQQALGRGKIDLDFLRLDLEAFQACPSDSIDYAVMEKTQQGAMVVLDSRWNDLGSWEALWQVGKKDDRQNVIKGDVCLEDVHNCFVHASSRLVTAVGLKDHVVVETKDAVFVSPRDYVQQVKNLVNRLKEQKRVETVNHKKAYRPWGSYEDLEVADNFTIKRVTVKPKAKLSSQRHMHRAEHWVVVHGTALVTKADEQMLLKEDQSTYIPLGMVHRLENPGLVPLELVEIQSGSYVGEDDIERLDDVYEQQKDK